MEAGPGINQSDLVPRRQPDILGSAVRFTDGRSVAREGGAVAARDTVALAILATRTDLAAREHGKAGGILRARAGRRRAARHYPGKGQPRVGGSAGVTVHSSMAARRGAAERSASQSKSGRLSWS